MLEPKNYRGVTCHNTMRVMCYNTMCHNDAKYEEELTCALKNDMKNLANFDPTLESVFAL